MGKKAKLLTIAASTVAVLALSIGAVVAAPADCDNTGNGAVCYSQETGNMRGIGACSEAMRDLLGLTQAEIQSQRHEGKSLVQIAADAGVDEQQLVTAMMAARRATVQERLAAGTLTQEQADFMLQKMEQNIVRAVNRTTTGQPEWAMAGEHGQQGCEPGEMKNHRQNADGAKPHNMYKGARAAR